MSSTTDLNPTSRVLLSVAVPIAASTQIVLNQYVGYNSSGYLVPCGDTAGIVPLGYSITNAASGNNSSGANGSLTANVVPFGNSQNATFWVMTTTGATQAWCGVDVYFLTDITVAQTGGVSHQILAGNVVQVLSSTSILVAIKPIQDR